MDGRFPAQTGELKMMSGATLHVGPCPETRQQQVHEPGSKLSLQTQPCPPPLSPTQPNSKQEKGVKSPTNTQCLYDVTHVSPQLPQGAHTPYDSPRRSAHTYGAKKVLLGLKLNRH